MGRASVALGQGSDAVEHTSDIDRAIEEIAHRLETAEDDGEVIRSAIYDLLHLGEHVARGVAAWVRSPHFRRRTVAAEVLARVEGRAAARTIEALYEDPHPIVRIAVCRALPRVKPGDAAEVLRRYLDDEEDEVVLEALRAIAALELDDLVDAVCRLLESPHFEIVDAAAGVLEKVGGTAALGPIAKALRDEESFSRRELVEAAAGILARAGESAFIRALKALAPPDRVALQGAAQAARDLPSVAPLHRLIQSQASTQIDRDRLRSFGVLLSEEAAAGRLRPARLRTDRVSALRRLVAGSRPHSVLLLGPSGAGKTALVHALATELAEDGGEVIEVRGADIIRGKVYLGQWQEHLLQLVDAVRRPRPVVLYVPDINEWVSLGKTVSSEDSAMIALRPYIERGDVVLLGETTPEAFRAGLGRYPQLASMLHVFHVHPATEEETLELAGRVLDEEAQRFKKETGYALGYDASLTRLIFDVATNVFSAQENPGRTLGLIRRLVADVQMKLEAGTASGDQWLAPHDVYDFVERQTGIPSRLLDDSVQLDLAEVRRFFDRRIIGQPDAVEVVVDLIALMKAGLTNPERPLSVLLFVGPTGVGKTELARTTAEYVFGSAERIVRIDMSEFQDPDAPSRLIGHTLRETGGLLTEPVREQPFCLVLLDEIEKAHPNVYDLLLQVFDTGRLTDARGRPTSFRRAVVVMTSNLGTDEPRGGAVGFVDSAERVQRDALGAVERHFRRELVNRIDHVIAFRSLGLDSMERIARRELDRVLRRSGLVRRGIAVDLDPEVLPFVLRVGFSHRYGARPLKRAIEQRILVPVARELIRVGHTSDEPPVLHVAVSGNQVKVRATWPRLARRSSSLNASASNGNLDAASLRATLRGLAQRATSLRESFDASPLLARRGQLSESLGARSVGPLESASQRDASLLHDLDALEDNLSRLVRTSADLLDQIEDPSVARDHSAVRRLADQTERLRRALRLVAWQLATDWDSGGADAFVHLERIDPFVPPGLDPVETVARGLLAALKSLGLRGEVLFEELRDTNDALQSATLRISGPWAWGLVRAERGLHRFGWNASDQRLRAYVRLHAWADVVSPSEVLREGSTALERSSAPNGRRVLAPRHDGVLTASHRPSLVTARVFVRSGEESAAREARELLAARLSARPSASPMRIVRHYEIGEDTTRVVDPHAPPEGVTLARVLDGVIADWMLARQAPRE